MSRMDGKKTHTHTIIETSTAEDHDDENLHNPSTRPRYSLFSRVWSAPNSLTTYKINFTRYLVSHVYTVQYVNIYMHYYYCCVCVFSSHPFWTSMDVPAGVTQEEGHTGFLIHLPSAVRALIFVARRIQPFLSLVDREVEFCVLTN